MQVVYNENLADKENIVDANVNDMIDWDCFINCPPLSKTKGCPKQKRMKGGRELGKKKKSYCLCKHVGHNITTCPEKDNCTSSNGVKKRKNLLQVKWDWIQYFLWNVRYKLLSL